MRLENLLDEKFLIGMSHMPPTSEGLEKWLYSAERNAAALMENGITSLILENDGDKDIVANPTFISDTNRLALVHKYMTTVGERLKRDYGEKLTIGVQILWNDWGSIIIAKNVGADFIRSQLYWERRLTPEGKVLEPVYVQITAFKQVHSLDVAVLADIDCKGTLPRGDYSREKSIAELLTSSYLPTALVVTGSATGNAPDIDSVKEFCRIVESHTSNFPVGGGSGLTPQNIELFISTPVRFWIVGSSLKRDGYVDPIKVRELTGALYARER